MIHRAWRRYPSYCCGDGESEERVDRETSDLKPLLRREGHTYYSGASKHFFDLGTKQGVNFIFMGVNFIVMQNVEAA
jgi:hypothetical protein